MNTFDITLATLGADGGTTGAKLSLRSVGEGQVELFALLHKPGPNGGKWAEQSLGRLHVSQLQRSIAAIAVLAGGEA